MQDTHFMRHYWFF